MIKFNEDVDTFTKYGISKFIMLTRHKLKFLSSVVDPNRLPL